MKKVLTLVILVAVAAGGYYGYERYTRVEQGMQLVTAQVTRGDVAQVIDAVGRLEAVSTVLIGSQQSGIIKALYADFNTQVKAGQIVAELEPELFETQVQQAEASLVRLQSDIDRSRIQLEDAQLKLARARDLSSRSLIPRTDLETAEVNAKTAEMSYKSAQAQMVQAEAQLNQAEVNLRQTVIRSPIDGVVISRDVDVGQTVAASMSAPTLLTVANDMTQMQVSANIGESDIGLIAEGQPVSFQVDAYPGRSFTGTVRQVRLNPVIEQNVVSYVTVINVPNPEKLLKPGMTANVTVEVARVSDTLRVPAAALRFEPTPEIYAGLGLTPPAEPEAQLAGGMPAGDGGDGASDAPGAGAPGGDAFAAGRGGSDADREALRAQMQNMSDEERQAFFAARGGGRGGRGGRGGNGRGGAAGTGQRAAGGAAGLVERAQIWVVADGQLQPMTILTGVSDGARVAVVGGAPLEEGMVLATGVLQAPLAGATNTNPTANNPLLPNFNRGRGGGGRGGRGGFGF
jgi:HlyD family secretion protein